MASRGFAKADRTRTQVPGRRDKPSAIDKVRGIPAIDHSERDEIITRLKSGRGK